MVHLITSAQAGNNAHFLGLGNDKNEFKNLNYYPLPIQTSFTGKRS